MNKEKTRIAIEIKMFFRKKMFIYSKGLVLTLKGFVSGSSSDKGLLAFLNASAPRPSFTSAAGASGAPAFLCDQYQKPAAIIITAIIMEARITGFDLKFILYLYNTTIQKPPARAIFDTRQFRCVP